MQIPCLYSPASCYFCTHPHKLSILEFGTAYHEGTTIPFSGTCSTLRMNMRAETASSRYRKVPTTPLTVARPPRYCLYFAMFVSRREYFALRLASWCAGVSTVQELSWIFGRLPTAQNSLVRLEHRDALAAARRNDMAGLLRRTSIFSDCNVSASWFSPLSVHPQVTRNAVMLFSSHEWPITPPKFSSCRRSLGLPGKVVWESCELEKPCN